MKIKQKRVMAFALAFVILISCMAIYSVASGGTGKIDGFNYEVLGRSWGSLEAMFDYGQNGNPHDLEVTAGDEIRIPLTADMFTWDTERTPLPRESLTLKELKSSKVEVRTLVQSGADALDYVQFDTDVFEGKPFRGPGSTVATGRTAYISVMFAEEFVDVNAREFSFDIYLKVNGQMYDDLKITLSGTMSNPVQYATSGNGEYDISDGMVLHAEDNVPSAELKLGKGVTINRYLIKDRKYYGTVKILPATDPAFGEEWPEAYPSIEAVYKLSTVNMRYGKSRVKITPTELEKTDASTTIYYVYGEDMKYYGTTAEELVYADVYFLSTEKIESFVQNEYLSQLSSAPTSEKVTLGEFENVDMDEAKLLEIKMRVEMEQTARAYRESLSSDNRWSSSFKNNESVGYGDERVDGDINVATPDRQTVSGQTIDIPKPSSASVVPGADVSPNVVSSTKARTEEAPSVDAATPAPAVSTSAPAKSTTATEIRPSVDGTDVSPHVAFPVIETK